MLEWDEKDALIDVVELCFELDLTFNAQRFPPKYSAFSKKWDHTEHRFTVELFDDTLAGLLGQLKCLTCSPS